MAKFNFSIRKFLISNWFVTLFSTMFGILAGLYISDYFEKKQLKSEQQEAFKMIKQEIRNNHQVLQDFDSISRLLFSRTSFILPKLNENNQLFIHKDSLDAFKEKSKNAIANMSFEKDAKHPNMLRVRGDMELFLNSKLAIITLNDVAWNSYKQTNYMSITSFNCITAIEELYKIQDNRNLKNRDWLSLFFKREFMVNEDKRNSFMESWRIALDTNTILLNFYDSIDDMFSDCN